MVTTASNMCRAEGLVLGKFLLPSFIFALAVMTAKQIWRCDNKKTQRGMDKGFLSLMFMFILKFLFIASIQKSTCHFPAILSFENRHWIVDDLFPNIAPPSFAAEIISHYCVIDLLSHRVLLLFTEMGRKRSNHYTLEVPLHPLRKLFCRESWQHFKIFSIFPFCMAWIRPWPR